MRAGASAKAELLALFADDAQYTEPFTGTQRTHRGIGAIARCFERSWTEAPPELELEVHRVDVDGRRASADWTCRSPAFDGPVSGRDEYEIVDGKIVALTVRFVSP